MRPGPKRRIRDAKKPAIIYTGDMEGQDSHLNPASRAGTAQEAADLTALLVRAQSGQSGAADQLLGLVYEQLRATAGSYFRNQRADHTLQPTALVHEAYLKLMGNPEKGWEGRAHFCAVASTAMRQILRDHARAKRAAKRGGGEKRMPLTHIETPSKADSMNLLDLDHALGTLSELDPRGARIVELRYFGGLNNEDIAEVLEVSLSTVERSWRRSRAWIRAELEGGADSRDTNQGDAYKGDVGGVDA